MLMQNFGGQTRNVCVITCVGRVSVVVVECNCSVSSNRSVSNGRIVSNVSSSVSDISSVGNVSIMSNVSIVRSLSSVSNISIVCNSKKKNAALSPENLTFDPSVTKPIIARKANASLF